MAKFKVTLDFYYDSEESIVDWNVDVPFEYVTTKEQAEELAQEELVNNSPYDFMYKVEQIEE